MNKLTNDTKFIRWEFHHKAVNFTTQTKIQILVNNLNYLQFTASKINLQLGT